MKLEHILKSLRNHLQQIKPRIPVQIRPQKSNADNYGSLLLWVALGYETRDLRGDSLAHCLALVSAGTHEGLGLDVGGDGVAVTVGGETGVEVCGRGGGEGDLDLCCVS